MASWLLARLMGCCIALETSEKNSMIQLNLVVIFSTDIDRAEQFYRLLGLDFIKHRHGSGPEHYTCELGEMIFEIYPSQIDTDSIGSVRLGFQVVSVDTAIAELMKQGAKIISLPQNSSWGRRAVVVDPDGHRVELTEKQRE